MFNRNLIKFKRLELLPFFRVEDVADLLGMKLPSASVFCSRYSNKGLLVKLKNNYYTTKQKLENITNEELFSIANILQVPSYISFMTGLAYYGATSRVQRNFIESASVKRSMEYESGGILFKYYKLNKKYYFDFERKNNLFIASPEKCFLDAVYLYSFGKYKLDFSSLDLEKLNKKRLLILLKNYPLKTKKIVRKICRI